MNETLRSVWLRLTTKWNAFTPTQRRNIIIALVAIIAALIGLLWVVMRPNYVTIMSGLDDKSLGQVQTELQNLKIPDEINGNSVLVPAKDANTARVQLAMSGLPQSGYIGYSSVSNSIGMTQDQFNLQVLDALQQSLNQTIESIDGIQSAQVHIVMPDQQIFIAEPQDPAKASVFVQLGTGVQLSSAQVAGIQQLVAHSVKGLTTDNVTVVDQNGVTLSGSAANNLTGTTGNGSSEMAVRQQMEQTMTQELTSGLDQIVGPGNAVVMVHANVTFNQVQSSAHIVQPVPGSQTGLPTSTQTTRSSSTSTSAGAGGPAGVSSTNPGLPTYAGTAGSGGNSTSSSSQVTTNYENSYVDTKTVNDPIQLKGYTVGVFLNANDKALTPAVVNQIKSFVSNAVGQSVANGANNITVSSVPFQSASTFTTGKSNMALFGGIALLLLLAGAGVYFVIRRRRHEQIDEDVPILRSDLSDDTLQNLPKSEDERMKDQLISLANQKPDEFANLLRTWLTE